MGYTTDFTGQFSLNKKLDLKLHAYLTKFNETRRMKRDVSKLPQLVSKKRRAEYKQLFGGFGQGGEFFVDGRGDFGQDSDASVINQNEAPSTQPGLWCQWRPSDDGLHIEWDEGEKFYEYVEWLRYIIEKFLKPNGYVLNGTVKYQGEDSDDAGWIVCENNVVRQTQGILIPQEPLSSPAPAPTPPQPELMEADPKRRINWEDK